MREQPGLSVEAVAVALAAGRSPGVTGFAPVQRRLKIGASKGFVGSIPTPGIA